MEVGRSQTYGTFRAHEQYREAMAELLQQTRARVRASQVKALEVGRELSERRAGEREASREAENARVRNEVLGAGREAENARVRNQVQGAGRETEGNEAPGRLARVDRVDISNASREVLARLGNDLDENEAAEERPKVKRLKAAYRNSKLFSPERLERASERLLDAGAELTRGTVQSSDAT